MVRGRLAPSPTGALHLGNARSFLLAWLSIRAQQGKVVLRIEDLDHPKVKKGAIQELFDDLIWLGLDWDEGPRPGDSNSTYIQSNRVSFYREALNTLQQQHLVYPCTCSRKDVEEAQSAPHHADDGPCYPGTCRNRYENYAAASAILPASRIPAWRVITHEEVLSTFHDAFHGMQQANIHQQWGDFVLARHPDGAGYMLAVVADDHAMGVTEVLRGDDLLSTTHKQLLLYQALDWQPPTFIHTPLVVSEDGRRLAKRHGDTRLSAFREKGVPPEKVIGLLAWWSGLADWNTSLHASELISRFSLSKLPPNPCVLDAKIRRYLSM